MATQRPETMKITFQNQSHLVLSYLQGLGIQPTLDEIAEGTDLMVLWAVFQNVESKKVEAFNKYYEKMYKKYKHPAFAEKLKLETNAKQDLGTSQELS
jgi:ABC-type branched-subunit amino acid transport system substrate-binding protein